MKRLVAFVSALALSTAVFAGSMGKKDIVDTAVKAGTFETLVAAVQAAELVDTLKGDGPYTVFAPSDDAFAALPEGTVENLLKPENKQQLIDILTLHVLPGKVMSADLAAGETMAASVQGEELKINVGDAVSVNGSIVTATDIEASNGVIHVIDMVILPAAS